jgi:Cu(I)/Ag(I) efflux system periplasmic protein CusF
MNRLLAFVASVLMSIAAFAQSASADGEVTKIDRAGGRISLKHGGLKPLDMPPMTIAFRVADPKLLDGVAVGDKVRFSVEKLGGNYTVTTLAKAR